MNNNPAAGWVLALDLEGTLISNAVSQIPRPGLYNFLEFCRAHFARVVLFTSVAEARVRPILSRLAEEGTVPAWAPDLSCVQWQGERKDLRFVHEADSQRVLLADDQERYIDPEQRDQWVPVEEFAPPYPTDDSELSALAERLLRRVRGVSEAG